MVLPFPVERCNAGMISVGLVLDIAMPVEMPGLRLPDERAISVRAGGVLQPQNLAGPHQRLQMPQDLRLLGGIRGQQRLQQQQQQQQQQMLLQRQRALQQQVALPDEAMGLHPGLQQEQQSRALYEQQMALLHLQQQQQAGFEHLDAVQLAELQGMPLPGQMLSDPLLSTDAMLGLQAQVTSHVLLT